jgi:hypothetical protein
MPRAGRPYIVLATEVLKSTSNIRNTRMHIQRPNVGPLGTRALLPRPSLALPTEPASCLQTSVPATAAGRAALHSSQLVRSELEYSAAIWADVVPGSGI